jgi:hypothetical protein
MTDTAQDRVPYSYDEVFPERFLHAPDLDGQTVTLRITDTWGEYVQNPKQKRNKERGDLCGVLAFNGTKREYAMSKQNAWILKALWGKDPAAYIGRRITIAAVPDTSGFTEHNTRILFVGSPDIDGDRAFTLPGGKAMTFRKTVAGKQTVVEPSVDAVTGEVADPDPDPDDNGGGKGKAKPAPAPQSDAAASAEVETPADTTDAQDDDAFEIDETPDSELDGIPEDEAKMLTDLGGGATDVPRPKVGKRQLTLIETLVGKAGIFENEELSYLDSLYGVQTREDLTAEQAEAYIGFLRNEQQALAAS